MSHCSVIIVTHNSQAYIHTCIDAFLSQTLQVESIIIVDSGSSNIEYLQKYSHHPLIKTTFSKENIGFCQGNNLGMHALPQQTEFVLFLNPDAYLTPNFIEKALEYMQKPSSKAVGALTGLLLGFDNKIKQPTGKIDSSGIFQSWYGRWYDRFQGEETTTHSLHEQEVPALCGALMFCRKKALDSVSIEKNVVMDPSFYMYKEDIDLSLRLSDKGWKLLFLPSLLAYHCRGWESDRSKVSRKMRLLSAKNELSLHFRRFSPYTFYSLTKYLAVKIFNI